jgi:polyhydroxybutyrate depolymerase
MSARRLKTVAPLIIAIVAIACGGPSTSSARGSLAPLSPSPSGGSDILGTFDSGGMTRSYLLHLPPRASRLKPLPLVVAFHGWPMTGGQMSRITHLSTVADAHGFAVLFPEGYKQSWAVPGSDTPAQKAGIDDVAFVRSLLDFLGPQYGVDSSNAMATGISNGGFLVQVLGCRLADHLAGIVPVASLISRSNAADCAPSRPVSVLEIYGTADALYGGDQNTLSFADTLAFWARADKCTGAAASSALPDTAHDQTTVTISSWTGCATGTEQLATR